MQNIRPRNFKKISLTPDGMRKRLSNIQRLAQGKTVYKYARFNTFADNMGKAGYDVDTVITNEVKTPFVIVPVNSVNQAFADAKVSCTTLDVNRTGNELLYRIIPK